MTPVHVSLTSIPPRLAGLGPVLAALAAQEGVAGVTLRLPRRYRDFPGPVTPPPLPEGVALEWVAKDLGPATKILPAILSARAPRAARILYCDDDWIYGPGWAATLIAAADADPGCAVAASCFDAARIGAPGWRVAQGFAGVLVTPAMLDGIAPPDGDLRLVDDVWLSAHLAARGTRLIEVPAARALVSPAGNEAARLQDRTDRARLNRAAAGWARRAYGL